ncbi:sulfite exporter TauE/SafE family protein [Thermopolyspora sp. NPDC052614]|uniref:sulfite exporter TauE/SafE family protein n=1 Tax=Thermopolyspora sp. NPDC052614 TaxID=3155682 RepID=UPI00341B6345
MDDCLLSGLCAGAYAAMGAGRGAGPGLSLDVGAVVAPLLVAGVAVLVGALVQSAVGLGLALLAAPVMTLLDPTVMPGALQVLAFVLPLLSLASEWRHVDWRGVRWVLLGRLPGTLAGVWVVKTASPDALAVIIGTMVLVAVALTGSAVSVARTPRTLALAGAVAGVTGTATSIGGPPVALVYQSAKGPQIRATLALCFAAGALLSMTALAAGGELPARALLTGAVLLPFVFAGFAVAGSLRRRLDGGRIRIAVLAVAAASAVALIVRGLWWNALT